MIVSYKDFLIYEMATLDKGAYINKIGGYFIRVMENHILIVYYAYKNLSYPHNYKQHWYNELLDQINSNLYNLKINKNTTNNRIDAFHKMVINEKIDNCESILNKMRPKLEKENIDINDDVLHYSIEDFIKNIDNYINIIVNFYDETINTNFSSKERKLLLKIL